MAESKTLPLTYKGHPLRRKDSLIYYGSMADSYIIMLQILSTEKGKGYGGGHQGRRPAPAHRPRPEKPGPGRPQKVKRTAFTPQWTWATSG